MPTQKIIFIINDFVIDPLGIMYLSAALKNAGHEVSIIKTVYRDYEKNALTNEKHSTTEVILNEEAIIRSVQKENPDIVAYSTTTGMHQYYIRINKRIKESMSVFSIFGGPHPTFFPEFIHEDGIDAVCIGEADHVFVEFVNKKSAGLDFASTENFWIKDNKGNVKKNKLRPLIDNLDSLPYPDRELIYKFESSFKNPIKNFIIGRGCPYDCTYCFNHAYYQLYAGKGRRVRLRSPENVISEIQLVMHSAPLNIVYFQDDIFILSHTWLQKFLPLYISEIKLPYHCHLRADLVTEKLLIMLKEFGCLSVTLALESGNDNIRNNLLKRKMSKEQIYAACSLLKRYKIHFRTENMVGLPGESISEVLETLRMNIRCKPDIGWASLYQPYPKTHLGTKCQEMGLYDGSFQAIRPSFFEKSILPLKGKRKIENMQKFFSLIVEFPFLLPVVLLLINLPSNKIFNKMYKFWKEYCYSRRLYNPQVGNKKLRFKSNVSMALKSASASLFSYALNHDLFSVSRRFQEKRVIILSYHGVTDLERSHLLPNFINKHIPVEAFEKQMNYVKRYYSPMKLSCAIDSLRNTIPLPPSPIVITFDDAYANVYKHAWPILKRLGIPAVLFIPSDFIGTDTIGWYDKIEWACDTAPYKNCVRFRTSAIDIRIDLSSPFCRVHSAVALKEKLRGMEPHICEEIADEILTFLNVDITKQRTDNYRICTTKQISEICQDLCEFGSHSATHTALTILSEEKRKEEISMSRISLARTFNKNITLFSYPYGMYNKETLKLVRASGYEAAVTTEYGVNDHRTDLYRLKRIGITGNHSFNFFVCSLHPLIRRQALKILTSTKRFSHEKNQ